ncbi:hypothetical protein A3K34_04715 [candidate division WWE3 bacterium RIFOXYC1_FULL_40_10]|uniref:Uncharacterized protein n=1 Tax=candidate division WWE3 bacterium RIFOXYA2_FULL_46_9 TaxID=1802636 RepID=A0A1F4W271_UNCKA|nr:MAG: hypothetical protein A3K58_04715 [candidate division WWE3 bacterium RIFOXYB1_FULL_40_22]OGC62140.1 MAG: hypothetical protein A3K37_04715 [candidate division WWE3 bacterium RIFOXYA1_FULL_40_11]OGC63153.1 MAG: hypothetical protein A2264_00460 [candidate division WWE3 bacterium RIFOXYA2_FULL_46_9]OGC64476.1 MAG: hypothetical protein A2326_04005 [candidate division WWE3 bacterium RIFOXYB2_FULL_41_6]OGC66523.1 MAG: hypothetical protein A3K34_04715 [candidate division WWE3 bacterium RIFOXYC1_
MTVEKVLIVLLYDKLGFEIPLAETRLADWEYVWEQIKLQSRIYVCLRSFRGYKSPFEVHGWNHEKRTVVVSEAPWLEQRKGELQSLLVIDVEKK